MYNIKVLPMAAKDIERTAEYIAEVLKAQKAANDFVRKIQKAVFSLQELPNRGKIRKDAKLEREYRQIKQDDYLIFYTVEEDNMEIKIYRVLKGRMDINKELQ